MEGMTKWRHQVHVAAGRHDAPDFTHDLRRVAHVLQYRVAFHALK